MDVSTLKKTTNGCNVWAVTTSLDVNTMADKDALKGTLAKGECTWKVALAANTVYALVLDDSGDSDHEVAGTVGPVSMTTWAGTAAGHV